MIRRVTYLLIVLLGTSISLCAKEVSKEVAVEYAARFMAKSTIKSIVSSDIQIFQADSAIYTYVVNFRPEGWALLSADDRAPAIIAYSEEGTFDIIGVKNVPFYFWFQNYADQIKNILCSKQTETHASWADESYYSRSKSIQAVEPLIPVKWNQGKGFNDYCPSDVNGPGGHAYAGCVAVAMAQCMSVYKHPTIGSGSHSYSHSQYGSQYVDFSKAEYKWDSMEVSSANKHVAKLLYHLGVSVNMNYGADGSGAYSTNVPTAIKTYFDYTNQAKYLKKSSYTDDEWVNILITELQNGRPIYYSGDNGSSGHAFNIDGVNSSGLFHLNWGYSGSYNGYYSLTNLTPGATNYNSNQEAVIYFSPRDHKPYGIILSNNSIKENLPVGSVVGVISAEDETPGDTHTFEVIAPLNIFGDPGYVPFTSDGDKLITTEVLKYSTATNYELIIKATDKTGYSIEKSFIINVLQNLANDVASEFATQVNLYYEKGVIYFSFNNDHQGQFSINIYNVQGHLIYKSSLSKPKGEYSNSLSLKDGIRGLHFLSFQFNTHSINKKILFY
jgi:hypothetical protein